MKLTFNDELCLQSKVHDLNYQRVTLSDYPYPWTKESLLQLYKSVGLTPLTHYYRYGCNEGLNPFLELDGIDVILTPENRDKISEINTWCNENIVYLSDSETTDDLYPEFWSYPTDGIDDCDGYAMAKQYKLNTGIVEGHEYPFFTGYGDLGIKSYLMCCWCYPDRTGYHAVTCVHADRGDFVLDSRYPDIKAVTDFGEYEWDKIETPGGIWKKVNGVEYDRLIIGDVTSPPSGYVWWRNRMFNDHAIGI